MCFMLYKHTIYCNLSLNEEKIDIVFIIVPPCNVEQNIGLNIQYRERRKQALYTTSTPALLSSIFANKCITNSNRPDRAIY